MESIEQLARGEDLDRFNIRDVLLIVLTASSGAVDAISYFGLGKIFSAFMTGNIVFLGFALARVGGPELLPVVLALAGFSFGAYAGTKLSLTFPEMSLWPVPVSLGLALTALAQAIFLAVWVAHDGQPVGGVVNLLLFLSSLAMGSQTAAVRALGVKGVFTTAATFTLLAYAGDLAGSRRAEEAPRLAGVLLALIAGSAAGGLLLIHAAEYAPILPLVGTFLVGVFGAKLHRRVTTAKAENTPAA